ncbi:hypothetical protein, partial [uncultured Treponema sp.]|uniref:hypothetical protein n=1 Tax=uncultured Treponema sp. TaxID=162155 RepID=UPI0025D80851
LPSTTFIPNALTVFTSFDRSIGTVSEAIGLIEETREAVGALSCRRIGLILLRDPGGLYASVGALRGRLR